MINKAQSITRISDVCDFPSESMGEVEKDFYSLLSKNQFPCPNTNYIPKGFNVTDTATKYLEGYTENNKANWYAYLQLGVCHYYLGEIEKAEQDWNKSIKVSENAWAHRNLAMVYRNEYHQMGKACECMQKAVKLYPSHRNLCQDLLETLVLAKEYESCVKAFDSLNENLKGIGRLQFYKAYSLTKLKRYDEATKIVNDKFKMDDIKEGEISISDLWIELYTEIARIKTGETDEKKLAKYVEKNYPLASLDFRMHVTKEE